MFVICYTRWMYVIRQYHALIIFTTATVFTFFHFVIQRALPCLINEETIAEFTFISSPY